MRKTLLLALTLSGLSFACQNNKPEIDEAEPVKVQEIDKVDKTEKVESLFGEFKTLYSELIDFKDKADFKKYGLGQGGPYYGWLKKVRDLKENPDSKLLAQKGVVVGELEQLGMAYASSKGEETDVTKNFNKYFTDAISAKPIETVETASGNSNYVKLKSEYDLFGKWRITNTFVKAGYPYEIYKKGNEFIGVNPEADYKTEILDNKGNKYFVKGNKHGEYYVIDSNLEMTLFDKDGELASSGFVAKRN